jgi:hypothetical protein
MSLSGLDYNVRLVSGPWNSGDAGEMDSVHSYLVIWRFEVGTWRLLAGHSCKLPPANP